MFASHSSSGGTSASCSNWAGVRLCFLSGTRSIVHSFFKHDNGFYHVREGDLFLDTFDRAEGSEATSRKGSLCALMVIKAIAAKYAGYGRSQPPLVRRGK